MEKRNQRLGGGNAPEIRGFFKVLRGKTSIADITKVVSYNDVNGNQIQEVPVLDGDVSHIYMGKMNEDEIGIYSDDFLRGILQYYFYCTPKGETVTLELANGVSEVLGESMQGFMDFSKQKAYIQAFVEKNFGKKELKRLEIIDLESRHPELFQGLRPYEKQIKNEANAKGLSYGELEKAPSFDVLDFLESASETPFLPEKDIPVTSLDIAKYLYRVCKINPAFFERIKEIKPEKAKSNFYPVIEMALRMSDFLNGVSIQGGAMKQKNYDAIIRDILNPYKDLSEYPELGTLRDFCIQRMGENKFETIYMDGNSKKYRALTEKISDEKHETSARRRIVGLTSSMLIAALIGYGGYSINQHKKLEKQTKETIEEIFDNKKVAEYGDMGSSTFEGNEKIERIEKYTQDIYKRFMLRYGDIGNFKESEFRAKIIDCLNNQEVLDMLGSYIEGSGVCSEDNVIDEYLIPQNIGEFKINNVSIIPYQQLSQYTDDFINTILLEKGIESNRDETYKTTGYRGQSDYYHLVSDIGEFGPKYGYYTSGLERYRFARYRSVNGKKAYILATPTYYDKFDKDKSYELSSQYAKSLAIDFLKQTYPVINEVLDQYVIRYERRENPNITNYQGPEKTRLKGNIEDKLLKDFLSKGLLKKINKKETAKIVAYLDDFVLHYQKELGALSGDINTHMMPNGFLEEYEDAMKNIIQDGDAMLRDNARLPVSSRGKNGRVVNHIGRYRAQDGKMYLVGSVKINDKKYLYAEDASRKSYDGEKKYGSYYGVIVAKDYFQTKAQFLQKKILYEKKLKSASQRYRPLPRGMDTNDYYPNTRNSRPK